MIPQSLGLLFRETVERFPSKKAIGFKTGGRYIWISWKEFGARVDRVAAMLLEKGFKKGDRLAILSENRPEWALMDLAAQTIGAISVPIYPSLTPAEIQGLLLDSSSRAIAISNKAIFEKLVPIQKSLKDLSLVIAFDSSLGLSEKEISIPLLGLKDLEKSQKAPDLQKLKQVLEAVKPEDVSSIIYTSGTTGVPKGVMLTHANFIENLTACQKALKMGPTDIHLSFLPLCHVFERMAGHYLMIHIGAQIAYAENLETVPANLLEVRPTFILGVPRFYEKMRDRVLEAVKSAPPSKQKLFYWAKALKNKKNLIANFLVYKKFKARLGGRIRFCVSGGAPLPREIAEFFRDLGVMIYEGYGLTETSPVISVNREGQFKFGSVGLPLENAQVKITAEGEIITAGPSVMQGYYHKPEETKEVLKEGWFYTGDLGRLDPDGFLVITGRKKELIVTSGGKKISPRPIEELIENDPLILRCVLFGEGQKFITALLVPCREKILEEAKRQKIAFTDYPGLLKDEKIYRFLESRIASLCSDLANFEKIKYFALLENDFSQEAGEMTPTLKVKREAVLAKHQDKLLRFYVD